MATRTKKTLRQEVSDSAKIVPNNVNTEQAILSCIIGGTDEIKYKLISELSHEDFYAPSNQLIFDHILKIYENSQQIDFVSIYDSLNLEGRLDEVGGVEYISRLKTYVASYSNYKKYLELIKRDSLRRKIIATCQDIISHTLHSDDKNDCLTYAEKCIFDLAKVEERADFTHIKDASMEVYEKIIQNTTNKGSAMGLMTGYYGLDKVTHGFGETDLIILAARPAVGKTSFAMNIVDKMAKNGKVVAVFSLEMGSNQLAQRLLCSNSNVKMSKVLSGELDENEVGRLMDSVDATHEKNIYIYDNSNITAAEVRTKCEELKRKVGLDFIMIDYLQLMQSSLRSGYSDASRQEQISEITRSIKIACNELKVPVLLLSQLSRAVELRNDHIPQLSDLRESGSIEQDADIVMFLHDPHSKKYKEEEINYKSDEERELASKGIFRRELIIAKHRNGECLTIPLNFRAENTTFLSTSDDNIASSLSKTTPEIKNKLKEKYSATEEEKQEFFSGIEEDI